MSVNGESANSGTAAAVRVLLIGSRTLECENAIFTTGRGLDGALREALDAGANATDKTVVHLISGPSGYSGLNADRIAVGMPGGRRVHWYEDCLLWSCPVDGNTCVVARGTKYACHFSVRDGLLTRHPGWPAPSLRDGVASARVRLSDFLANRGRPSNDFEAFEEHLKMAA